jgi:hypothetical protein
MTRERWFCCLCGAVTTRRPNTAGRVFCHAHAGLTVDEAPPDPLESIPTLAAQLREDTPTRKGKAI